MTLEELNAAMPFARLIGVTFTHATPDEVRAEMIVREDLCTTNSILHGGAAMALADTVGAAATVLNLPPGKGTTTIESKTNFLSAGPAAALSPQFAHRFTKAAVRRSGRRESNVPTARRSRSSRRARWCCSARKTGPEPGQIGRVDLAKRPAYQSAPCGGGGV